MCRDDLDYHAAAGASEAQYEELENNLRCALRLSWDDVEKDSNVRNALNDAVEEALDQDLDLFDAADFFYGRLKVPNCPDDSGEETLRMNAANWEDQG